MKSSHSDLLSHLQHLHFSAIPGEFKSLINTLQGTSISHLGRRKLSSKVPWEAICDRSQECTLLKLIFIFSRTCFFLKSPNIHFWHQTNTKHKGILKPFLPTDSHFPLTPISLTSLIPESWTPKGRNRTLRSTKRTWDPQKCRFVATLIIRWKMMKIRICLLNLRMLESFNKKDKTPTF